MSRINELIISFKNNYYHWIFLILLILILIIIAFFRVKIQTDIGAPYDTYDFLANSAEFADMSIGYTDVRPPFLSFLTSIIFRFDGLSTYTIFYMDAMLDIIGIIGLYFFLKLRFNNLNSFFGSLIYATFPIVLTYMGVGYPDLPSVAISIWALYFTVLAVKRDSKFFLLAFPIAMLAFLTKYNMALIIFPMFFFILVNWQKIKKQNLIIGILISLVIITPILIYYNFKYGNPLFPFLDFYSTSTGLRSEFHFDYNTDLLFYVKLFPIMLGNGVYLIILTLLGGLLLYLGRLFKKNIGFPIINIKQNYKKRLLVLILLVFFIIGLGKISYILSELIFFILLFGIFRTIKNKENHDLDFLFFSWFATLLIFNSVYLIKDIRYFPTMMPPISYFLIRGLVLLENQIGLIKKRKLTTYVVPIVVLVILISTTCYITTIPKANENSKTININIEDASQWLINYDPEYKSKVIYSDLWPLSGWFLQTQVQKMPQFKDNKTYYYSLKDYKPTRQDSEDANGFLVENSAEYYFSTVNGLNLTSFKPIKQFGIVIIYKRL